ncbi:MAG: carbohydrate kinase family protein, partial [Hadesarchaea archaeon]|nr:carbohydrate kinase family protein [Hadesarchaea archaeon]
VDTRDVVVSEGGATGVTVALVEGAERSFITYRGENAKFSMRDVSPNRLDADLIHLPSFFLMEKLRPKYSELIGLVRKKTGGIISFDTGWNPFGWRREVRSLKNVLRQVDIFLPNLDEAKGILARGKHRKEGILVRRLLDFGLKVVAMKMGDRGVLISDRCKSISIPAFKVKTVDTTGAGDVFNAALAVAYLKGRDIAEAGKFASAAAALSTTGAGWSKYPTLKQVNDFLKQRGF